MELEEGWSQMQVRCMARPMSSCRRAGASDRLVALQNGINKLIRLLEGEPEAQFNAEQYMMLYT